MLMPQHATEWTSALFRMAMTAMMNSLQSWTSQYRLMGPNDECAVCECQKWGHHLIRLEPWVHCSETPCLLWLITVLACACALCEQVAVEETCPVASVTKLLHIGIAHSACLTGHERVSQRCSDLNTRSFPQGCTCQLHPSVWS